MGRLPPAPSWGSALTPDAAGFARPSPGRAQTRPDSALVSRRRLTVPRHSAISPRSPVAGAEVAPNKCIELARRRSGVRHSSQTARSSCTPR